MTASAHHRSGTSFGWRSLAVLLFFALVGGFLLSAEHRAHTLGILPFLLILLLCPLMHIFMHGGHGGHDPEAAEDAYRRSLAIKVTVPPANPTST